jgi:hypothetical protein
MIIEPLTAECFCFGGPLDGRFMKASVNGFILGIPSRDSEGKLRFLSHRYCFDEELFRFIYQGTESGGSK